MARNKKTGEYFAMKILKKADIIKLKQVDHVISENTILADIDHPFLVKHYVSHVFTHNVGWIKRIFSRYTLSILFNGLYSWWRIIHIFENRGQIDFRTLAVITD